MPRSTERKQRRQPPPGIPVLDIPRAILTSVYGPPELEDEMDVANPEDYDTDGSGSDDDPA